VRGVIAALDRAAADDAVRAFVIASALPKVFAPAWILPRLPGARRATSERWSMRFMSDYSTRKIASASRRSRRSMAPRAAAA